jgi:hypothetical protein
MSLSELPPDLHPHWTAFFGWTPQWVGAKRATDFTNYLTLLLCQS